MGSYVRGQQSCKVGSNLLPEKEGRICGGTGQEGREVVVVVGHGQGRVTGTALWGNGRHAGMGVRGQEEPHQPGQGGQESSQAVPWEM